MLIRWLTYSIISCFALGLIGILLIIFAALVTFSSLPSLETLTDYRPKIPLRVYSDEGLLIGEFGTERRSLVKIDSVPVYLKQAILAAEDDRFYEHSGVDTIGVLRAAYSNFTAGGVRQGASTITMQVARNFFLTREKTLTRKFSEALLAFKIEHYLSKDQILELYINQIYLGQRSYGFAAAAKAYFDKSLNEINVAEAAMLAGLPKAPSHFNPVVNPERAKTRQLYVLRRMHKLNLLSDNELKKLEKQPVPVNHKSRTFAMHAEYVAEMARQVVYDRYQTETYTSGIKVYTTIRKADQEAAYQALRKNVMNYDKRHGYRGPEGYINLPENGTNQEKALKQALLKIADSDDIYPAIVLTVNNDAAQVYRKDGKIIAITGEGLQLVKKFLTNQDDVRARNPLRPGAIVRIQENGKDNWEIVQFPEVEAALASIDPRDGAVLALIGGFDFHRNQFNHVTQAWRQPGSSFKPFIYSASLDKGFTPATIINDAPLSFDASQTGSELWEPRNFDGKYSGPIRMREALAKSKNLASIRILQAIGLQYAQDYITRFGFEAEQHPPYLPMALGSGVVTAMQMAAGYATFANGGYEITPYFIKRIEDKFGNVLETAQPPIAGKNANQIIDPRNAFLITSMMQDVINRGTATRAKQLGRNDIAGKTGTTSNFIDAWFCGFQKHLVAVAWIGYDDPKSLGKNETGGRAALPMWMDYMEKALKNVPLENQELPQGIITAKINPDTGLRESAGTITEHFFQEQLPPQAVTNFDDLDNTLDTFRDQLF